MSTTETTIQEMAESLTGYDELAIKKEFRLTVSALVNDGDTIASMRAYVFVHQRRQGLKDSEAYAAAMEMRQADILAYFSAGDDDEEPADDLGEA